MQDGLPLLAIQLARLLAEEAVDVGIAAVDIDAAADDERFDSGGRVAEGAVAALDETTVFLLDPSLLECRPLDGPKLHANANGVEIVNHRLAHVGQRRITEVVASV